MFKAKDLRERTPEDLRELEKTLTTEAFQNRFKNFTNRLDDTSAIKKARRDLARVKTILAQQAKAAAPAEAPAAPQAAPKAAPKKKAAPKAEVKSAESTSTKAAPKAAKKSAKKTAAKDEAK